MTFFTIFLILVGLNAIILLSSLQSINKKTKKPTPKFNDVPTSIIYPIDLLSTNYKKAV